MFPNLSEMRWGKEVQEVWCLYEPILKALTVTEPNLPFFASGFDRYSARIRSVGGYASAAEAARPPLHFGLVSILAHPMSPRLEITVDHSTARQQANRGIIRLPHKHDFRQQCLHALRR